MQRKYRISPPRKLKPEGEDPDVESLLNAPGTQDTTIQLTSSSRDTQSSAGNVGGDTTILAQGDHIDDPDFRAKLLSMDYTVDFSKFSLQIHLENLSPLTDPRYDPDTNEFLHILFGVVTVKGALNELQLARLLDDIHQAGCHTHTYDAKSGTGLRITRICVSDTRLLKYAEAIDFHRGLDPEKIRRASHEAGLFIENPKTAEGRTWYDPYEHLSAPYRSAHHQLFCELTEGERIKLCRLLVTGDKHFKGDAKGCGLDIQKLELDDDEDEKNPNSFCLGVFPLHNPEKLDALRKKWMPWDWSWNLPVHDIMEYFGEEIGFYFGFLGHFVDGLVPMAPFALVAQAFGALEQFKWGYDAMYSNGVFAIVFTCAYSVILGRWKYKQSSFAHLWHSFGAHRSLPPRPGFKGKVLKNPTTGGLEIDFPSSERFARRRLSVAFTAAMIFLLLVTTSAIFSWKAELSRQGDGVGVFLQLLPSLLNAIQISVYAIVYKIVADKLTDFENHKTVVDHNASLFRKLTFFYFLSNFSAPLYIAFIKPASEGSCLDPLSGSTLCGHELSTNIVLLFVVNDFLGRMYTSVVAPHVMRMFHEYQVNNDKTTDVSKMGPVEKQHRVLSKYDPTSELVLDYIELYVQWGYLTLFGASCPVVVLIALFSNYIETRTDGMKLFVDYRRVLPNRVDGIGEPLSVFYFTLYVAVPVNCGLIVYTFNAVDFLDAEGKIWMMIFIGAFMALVLSQLDVVYPSVPMKTAIQLERQNVVYQRVFLGEEATPGDLDFELHESMVGKSVAKARKMHQQSKMVHGGMMHSISDAMRRKSFPASSFSGGANKPKASMSPEEAGMTIRPSLHGGSGAMHSLMLGSSANSQREPSGKFERSETTTTTAASASAKMPFSV